MWRHNLLWNFNYSDNNVPPSISAEPFGIDLNPSYTSEIIILTATHSWVVVNYPIWLSVNPASGLGSGNVTLSMIDFPSSYSEGSVTFRLVEYPNMYATVMVYWFPIEFG